MFCFSIRKHTPTGTVDELIERLKQQQTPVKELSIVEVLDDNGLEALCGVFRDNRNFMNLQHLRLARNSLSASSCTLLAQAIHSPTALYEVDLSDNRLGEHFGFARQESTSSIDGQIINISSGSRRRHSSSSFAESGLAKLVDVLTLSTCQVRILKLNNNKLGPKSSVNLAVLIRKAKCIRSLQLANNALGTKTIKTLCSPLFENSTLEALDLSYNNVSDRGASLLASVLDPTGVSSNRIKVLNLTYNKIGPSGAQCLARAVLTNRYLRKLDLSLNRIGPNGVESFGAVLKYSFTLQELILSRNNVGESGEGVHRLLSGLQDTEGTNLERLDLSWNSLKDEAAAQLAAILSSNATLKYLNLSSNAIGNSGVKALAESLLFNVGLRELNLIGNQADDKSVDALSKVLKRPESSGLKLLWTRNNFTAHGCQRLRAAMSFRQHVQSWLGRCLKDIERHLALNLDLEQLPLGDDEMIALCKHLVKYSPRVPLLRISGQLMSDKGLSVLARDVIASNNLERIYFNRINLRDVGVASLAESILINKSVRILSLVSCGISCEGVQVLSNAVRKNATIQQLDLQGNAIGDAGAREVFSAVLDKVEPTVLSLNLSCCNITDDGMLVPSITHLESLFLGQNEIKDYGALDLAKAIIGCTSLRWLDCSDTCMSWKAFETLKLFLPSSSVVISNSKDALHFNYR